MLRLFKFHLPSKTKSELYLTLRSVEREIVFVFCYIFNNVLPEIEKVSFFQVEVAQVV